MRTLPLGQTERKASEVSARGFSEKGGAFRNQRRSDCTRLWGERGGGLLGTDESNGVWLGGAA